MKYLHKSLKSLCILKRVVNLEFNKTINKLKRLKLNILLRFVG